MEQHEDSKIIDALGGTAEVARLCKIKQPSVSEWRREGIPPARRQFLELLRPEVFGAAARKQDTRQRHRSPAASAGATAEATPTVLTGKVA